MGPPARGPSVLHYGEFKTTLEGNIANRCVARAMYTYSAAIPEELSFAKGDILAVLRLQDDGWWEAEVKESSKGTRPGTAGLVPSNYLQKC